MPVRVVYGYCGFNAETIERKLGLEGQPRAIVFHEKEGRRHAQAIWSRIDPGRIKIDGADSIGVQIKQCGSIEAKPTRGNWRIIRPCELRPARAWGLVS